MASIIQTLKIGDKSFDIKSCWEQLGLSRQYMLALLSRDEYTPVAVRRPTSTDTLYTDPASGNPAGFHAGQCVIYPDSTAEDGWGMSIAKHVVYDSDGVPTSVVWYHATLVQQRVESTGVEFSKIYDNLAKNTQDIAGHTDAIGKNAQDIVQLFEGFEGLYFGFMDLMARSEQFTPACHVLYTDLYNCYMCSPKTWSEDKCNDPDNVPQGVLLNIEEHTPIIIGLKQAVLPWNKNPATDSTDVITSITDGVYGFDPADMRQKNTEVYFDSTEHFVRPNPQGCLDYAPTYCWNYTLQYDGSDANTHGIGRMGDWMLPTLGVLKAIDRHKDAINSCLEAVGGNSIAGRYWSINEINAAEAWTMTLNGGGGITATADKNTVSCKALPVMIMPRDIRVSKEY